MEMEVLENLQELKELNQRQAQVDFEGMISQYRELEKREKEREKEEDERETKEMLERVLVKRLRDSDSDSENEEESSSTQSKNSSTDKPTDILTTYKPHEAQEASAGGVKRAKLESWERSVGTLGGGGALGSLVVRKKPAVTVNKSSPSVVATADSTSQTDSKASPASSANKPITTQNGSSSLSLLGAYSDSDSNDSE